MKKKILLLFAALLFLLSAVGCNVIYDMMEYESYYEDLTGSVKDTNLEEYFGTDEVLKVEFIDVGQGDSSLIITPDGKSMLIDSGEYYAYDAVKSALNAHKITKIDALVATHPHSDHIGCMANIIEDYEISTIYMPNAASTSKSFETLLNIIEKKKLNVIEAKAGTEIELGDQVEAQILSPIDESYDDTNNYSAVVHLTFGDISYIFMGDAETIVEEELIDSGQNIKADVIKLGHHGSSTSSSEDFLKKVNPIIGVISCGTDNSYGHPHEETLETLNKLNIKYFRTDEKGNILVATDGNELAVIDSLNNNLSTDSEPSSSKNDKTQDVYVTKTGSKYHTDKCRYYHDNCVKLSKEDAEANGYEPCESCNP